MAVNQSTANNHRQTSRMNTIRFALLFSIGSCVLGCGGSSPSREGVRKSAKDAFNAAETAFDAKDFSTAEKEYAAALGGGLYIDLIDTARVKQAVSRAELGDLDQAMADLVEMERDAMEMDLVYSAQSYVLAKQGESGKSKAAWKKARRINRRVRTFGK